MTTKFFNFLAMAWFFSILICLVLEGSSFAARETSVLNDLLPFSALKVGGLVAIPAASINFFRGMFRILTFDYSFYEDGYVVLRYFWVVILSPGAIWGITSTFAPVFANLLRIYR